MTVTGGEGVKISENFEVIYGSPLIGRRLNGFLGLPLNDWTIIFLVILFDKTVSIGEDSVCIKTLA